MSPVLLSFLMNPSLGRPKKRRLMKLALGAVYVSSRQYLYPAATLGAHGFSMSIGKSSVVRKQHQLQPLTQLQLGNQDNPSSSLLFPTIGKTSNEILQLAQKNVHQIHGSKTYIAAWRHWMERTTAAIRLELSNTLPYPVQMEELTKLSFSLGVAADKGEMPSFSNPGARSGYALDYFCRARLLANLFMMPSQVRDDLTFFWKQHPQKHSQESIDVSWTDNNNKMEASSKQELPTTIIHLTSLGGGPGFDFVGVAMAVTYMTSGGDTQHLPPLQATILDYEEGWKDLVQAMNDATMTLLQPSNWNCQWGGKCDITKSLTHSNNQACLANIATTNIWTCQYCVAENAQKLRASNYVFFQDLFHAIPNDTIILLTETTPRLWPELYTIVEEYCPFMQVTFPNQKGHQMFLKKSCSRQSDFKLSLIDAKLLKNFQSISTSHEIRLLSGWERQMKKQKN